MWLNIEHKLRRTEWSSYLNNSMSKNSCTIATAALCLALQACGSSGSGSGDQVNADPVFSAPVSAATLSDALTTEEPGVPSNEYWQCSVGGSGILLEYRFSSDSSGVETDVSNAGAQSTFSWQTTSASAFTTTVTSTGGQNEVADIAFNGRDAFNAVVNSSATFSCQRKGQRSEPIGPDADNVSTPSERPDGVGSGDDCAFILSEDITVPTQLINTDSNCDYLMTRGIDVESLLIIEPGTVI